MNTATLTQTGDLASELFALLRETDPASFTHAMSTRAKERWSRIRASVEELSTETAAPPPISESVATLRALMDESAIETSESASYWLRLRPHLMAVYERLAGELRRRSVRAPTLRPTNWPRIGFHVSSAVGALLLLEVFLSRTGTLWATGAFAVYCWVNETGRVISKRWNERLMRVRFFRAIIHPHEHHHVNSATWYGTALVILAFLVVSTSLCIIRNVPKILADLKTYKEHLRVKALLHPGGQCRIGQQAFGGHFHIDHIEPAALALHVLVLGD